MSPAFVFYGIPRSFGVLRRTLVRSEEDATRQRGNRQRVFHCSLFKATFISLFIFVFLNYGIRTKSTCRSIHIEVFRLNESNHWELEEYNSADEELHIKAIDEKMMIAEIYDGVKMEG